MNTNEPIQSAASRTAYAAWETADRKATEARTVEIQLEIQIKRLQAELRAARKATKAARLAEAVACREYEAVPYCAELVDA